MAGRGEGPRNRARNPAQGAARARNPAQGAARARNPAQGAARARLPSIAALVLLLLATGVISWVARALVDDQEHRLLQERATEVGLVLSTSVNAIAQEQASLAQVAAAPSGVAFEEEAASQVAASKTTSIALLQSSDRTGAQPAARYTVVAGVGPSFAAGQVVTGPVLATLAAAEASSSMVATPIIGSVPHRLIGFVLRVRPGLLVYRQIALGPVRPPKQSGTVAFQEIRAVLYATARPDPAQVLVATTSHIPLTGAVAHTSVMAGQTKWFLLVEAKQPLVGGIANFVPWGVLIVGAIGSLVTAGLIDSLVRRRDAALDLYRAEHRVAATLQMRLLPELPDVPGIEVVSAYLTASDEQQVGGDWFDVFDAGPAGTAVVIGDVMGHDVEAAASMAQVRAALRAYGAEGSPPALVVERLSRLTDRLGGSSLVTVVYGVIGPPASDGSRLFEWTNAGHLPPLVLGPDGAVAELTDGGSPIVGAPTDEHRAQGIFTLGPGATLFLYTDGLVEEERVDLTESVAGLRARLASAAGKRGAELRDAVLAGAASGSRRDDIALILLTLTPDPSPAARPETRPETEPDTSEIAAGSRGKMP